MCQTCIGYGVEGDYNVMAAGLELLAFNRSRPYKCIDSSLCLSCTYSLTGVLEL